MSEIQVSWSRMISGDSSFSKSLTLGAFLEDRPLTLSCSTFRGGDSGVTGSRILVTLGKSACAEDEEW